MALIGSASVFLLSAWLLAQAVRPRGAASFLFWIYLLFLAQIVTCANALSAVRLVADGRAWCCAQLLVLAAAWLIWRIRGSLRAPLGVAQGLRRLGADLRASDPVTRWTLYVLAAGVLLTGLVNFVVSLFVPPNNWDSLTYHLSRGAYWLQNGTLAHWPAHYWAQTIHPRNASIVMMWIMLCTGSGDLTFLVQFAAHAAATLSVMAISRTAGCSRLGAVFAGAMFALFEQSILQQVTTQTDMAAAACVGIAAFGLLRLDPESSFQTVGLVALAFAIGVGTKSSVLLAIPSLALLAGIQLMRRRHRRMVLAMRLAGATAVFVLLLGSQSFIANTIAYGHPLGPREPRLRHLLHGEHSRRLVLGVKNMLRFGSDFVSADPFAGSGGTIQRLVRKVKGGLSARLETWLGLTQQQGCRDRFRYVRAGFPREDTAYLGPLGPLLLWPLVLFHLVRGRICYFRGLAGAALAYFIAQAFCATWDPGRGRQMLSMAVLAAPLAGTLIGRVVTGRAGQTAMIGAAALSLAVAAATLCRNEARPLLPSSRGFWQQSRLRRQLVRSPDLLVPYARFEELVPRDAVVAAYLGENVHDFPLFGPRLARRIVPVYDFQRGALPIPEEAEWLVYFQHWYDRENWCPYRKETDIKLGEHWFLRRLPRRPTGDDGR